jgi:hypothetical protein
VVAYPPYQPADTKCRLINVNNQQNDKKEIKTMTNDEQLTEVQDTDAIAAVQVISEEVEIVSAMSETVDESADPNEDVSVEVEAEVVEDGEEE